MLGSLVRSKALLVLALFALTGCAATYTAVAKRNLDVQTKMTDTIFLDPVAPAERTVFVEVKNTSDKPDLDLAGPIRERIASRGYQVVDDPRRARYILQANVLQAGRTSETAAEQMYGRGYGAPITGAAVGGTAGYVIGKAAPGNAAVWGLGGAVVGGLAETVAGAAVQDVTYSIITDIQIQERAPGEVVSETRRGTVRQGRSGEIAQTSSRTTDMRRHTTRVMSMANKVNLEWAEAAPQLVDGLTRVVAGIF
ncbi:MAG: complement resistance protein TraT [Geminicoccaceae bacterium]|nr:complement resistance protein TraT [Geminicoccaceae bacterium]